MPGPGVPATEDHMARERSGNQAIQQVPHDVRQQRQCAGDLQRHAAGHRHIHMPRRVRHWRSCVQYNSLRTS